MRNVLNPFEGNRGMPCSLFVSEAGLIFKYLGHLYMNDLSMISSVFYDVSESGFRRSPLARTMVELLDS